MVQNVQTTKKEIKGEIDDSGNIVKIKFDHDSDSGKKKMLMQ